MIRRNVMNVCEDFSMEREMIRRWLEGEGGLTKQIMIGDKEKLSCWRSQKEFEMEIISFPQLAVSGVCYEFMGVVDKKYYVELLLFEDRLDWHYKGKTYNDWCDLYWEEIKQMKLFDYSTDGWTDDEVMYGIQREEAASGEWK